MYWTLRGRCNRWPASHRECRLDGLVIHQHDREQRQQIDDRVLEGGHSQAGVGIPQYAEADVPMLPVTHGERYTKLHILLYTILMVLVTLLPYLTGMSGWLYLLGAMILGAGFLYWAIRLYRDAGADADSGLGMTTFKYSIVYLLALFAIMLVDDCLTPGVPARRPGDPLT